VLVLAIAGASTGFVSTSDLEQYSRDQTEPTRRYKRPDATNRTRSPAHQHAVPRIVAVGLFACNTGDTRPRLLTSRIISCDSEDIARTAILF